MTVPFEQSITKDNLMRAFAGESQARNRYQIAASAAKKMGFQVVEAVFTFTANQEKEHAEIFYEHLAPMAGANIQVDGAYPVDIYNDALSLLRAAQHNEYEEYNQVYAGFANTAQEEGFPQLAASFRQIAAIEKTHGDRFGRYADMVEQNTLYISDVSVQWMCLNCGHIFTGTEVPALCPVCDHDRGYFIRFHLAPYEG